MLKLVTINGASSVGLLISYKDIREVTSESLIYNGYSQPMAHANGSKYI